MTQGAWTFMFCVWAVVAGTTVYCFWKLLTSKRRLGDTAEERDNAPTPA